MAKKKPFLALPSVILASTPSVDSIFNQSFPALDRAFALLSAELSQVREQGDPMKIARAFVAVHRMNEILKELVGDDKSAGLFRSIYSRQKAEVVPEAFENAGIDQTLPLAEGFRVTVGSKLFASLPAERRRDGFEWLRTNGLGDLIQETVNAQTLSATAQEMMGDGKELPADIFSVHMKGTTSVTRTK